MQANNSVIVHPRRRTILVGILLLISSLASASSQMILDPILLSPDFLDRIAFDKTVFTVGIFAELIYAVSAISVAAAFYVLLKLYSQTIAITYLSFRSIEASISFAASICFLTLLTLGQFFSNEEIIDTSEFYDLGIILITMHDWAWFCMLLIYYISGFILNYLLWRKNLVARFISIFGLLAALLGLVSCMLQLFGITLGNKEIISLLTLPFLIQELILALYIIFKGFKN